MTRAEAIREFIASRRSPATIGEIQIGLEDQRQIERVDRDKFAARVGAQISQLMKAGKLVRTGLLGSYRYALAPDGNVDRRLRPANTKSTARKRRKADKPEPAPAPRMTRPAHTRLVLPNQPSQTAPPKLNASDQIARDVAAFLAQGGHVEHLPPGQSANPTRAWLEANGLAKPRKPRKHPTPTTDDADLDDVAA